MIHWRGGCPSRRALDPFFLLLLLLFHPFDLPLHTFVVGKKRRRRSKRSVLCSGARRMRDEGERRSATAQRRGESMCRPATPTPPLYTLSSRPATLTPRGTRRQRGRRRCNVRQPIVCGRRDTPILLCVVCGFLFLFLLLLHPLLLLNFSPERRDGGARHPSKWKGRNRNTRRKGCMTVLHSRPPASSNEGIQQTRPTHRTPRHIPRMRSVTFLAHPKRPYETKTIQTTTSTRRTFHW